MHLLGQRPLGIAILLLLGVLVAAKRLGTGSVIDRPQGRPLVQLVNVFNLLFLLLVNPAAAVLLILDRVAVIDPTHLTAVASPSVVPFEALGLILYVTGVLTMAWALTTLGRSYQLGGLAPRDEDRITTRGPYALVRHPMYTSVLSISLGLALLIQSAGLLFFFVVYMVLLSFLIPIEEEGLRNAYAESYDIYRRKVGCVIPFFH